MSVPATTGVRATGTAATSGPRTTGSGSAASSSAGSAPAATTLCKRGLNRSGCDQCRQHRRENGLPHFLISILGKKNKDGAAIVVPKAGGAGA